VQVPLVVEQRVSLTREARLELELRVVIPAAPIAVRVLVGALVVLEPLTLQMVQLEVLRITPLARVRVLQERSTMALVQVVGRVALLVRLPIPAPEQAVVQAVQVQAQVRVVQGLQILAQVQTPERVVFGLTGKE
jgi:hypothetical protein